MTLAGKVALVTGSSQGIGQAIAAYLAKKGADIVIDYRSHPDGAKETLAKVEAAGRKGHIVQADLSLVNDVRKLISEGIGHFGKLDILVNNAGVDGKNANFWDITEVDYDMVLNINLTPYCASKGGVKMMMRNLAVELGPMGITINNIAPGAIETPINTKLLNDPVKLNSLKQNIPLGRLGTPDDIAPMVAFLASSAADYVTGATFYVDGGLIRNYHEQ